VGGLRSLVVVEIECMCVDGRIDGIAPDFYATNYPRLSAQMDKVETHPRLASYFASKVEASKK